MTAKRRITNLEIMCALDMITHDISILQNRYQAISHALTEMVNKNIAEFQRDKLKEKNTKLRNQIQKLKKQLNDQC